MYGCYQYFDTIFIVYNILCMWYVVLCIHGKPHVGQDWSNVYILHSIVDDMDEPTNKLIEWSSQLLYTGIILMTHNIQLQYKQM